MMVLTLLLLTFLSMAVGAPKPSRHIAVGAPHLHPREPVAVESESLVEDLMARPQLRQTDDFIPFRFLIKTAAPPPQDLLGQYIFTTYHLLLKEIRNEANGTEIVDLRNSVGYVPTFLVEPIGVRSQSTQTREKPSIVDPEARPAESPFPAPLPGMKELDKDA